MLRSLFILAGAAMVASGCAESAAPPPAAAEAARACAGVPDAQARASLIDLRHDVESVEPVRETALVKASFTRSGGVDIRVRAGPGMTAQWLARLVECHVALEAAGAVCGTAECPLGLARVATSVSSEPTGFVIAIRSDDIAVAREITRRSRLLFDPPPAAPMAAQRGP